MQCQPWSSVVEAGFWSVFAQHKLDTLRLSDAPVAVRAHFAASRSPHIPPQLRLTAQDVLPREASRGAMLEVGGQLLNCNTVEDFKALDKRALLERLGRELDAAVAAGECEREPALLTRFAVVSFADLKKHSFLYWFCFPAAVDTRVRGARLEAVPAELLSELAWQEVLPPRAARPAFFAVAKDGSVCSLAEAAARGAGALAALGMADPSADPEHAGWPLFNLAHWALQRVPGAAQLSSLDVLCVRQGRAESVVAHLELIPGFDTSTSTSTSAFVGWEPNLKGKMGPRLMELGEQLDPERLAKAACDLNLKLMRWRALPDLDPARMAACKCLLIGAGTLGCCVARSLLGWGFRDVTFVDSGVVSYSNPVRQWLFEFEDCKQGGKSKALAAAEALRRITPGVNARGVQLSVPMPGHFCTSDETVAEARRTAHELEELVRDCDVVCLLTDTRESRWLPTLLAAKHNKLVLNSALGFDAYMVMRHGAGVDGSGGGGGGGGGPARLGCYFCNDVVAPQNSMKDRTIDQQCTVTRPGLAPIASALLVELLVSILHHPLRHRAPAPAPRAAQAAGAEPQCLLGELPHQIRGSLPRFEQMSIAGEAFPQCTACSGKVVDAFAAAGFNGFLLRAFNEPSFLEDLTGLTELRSSAAIDDLLMGELGFDSDDDQDAATPREGSDADDF